MDVYPSLPIVTDDARTIPVATDNARTGDSGQQERACESWRRRRPHTVWGFWNIEKVLRVGTCAGCCLHAQTRHEQGEIWAFEILELAFMLR